MNFKASFTATVLTNVGEALSQKSFAPSATYPVITDYFYAGKFGWKTSVWDMEAEYAELLLSIIDNFGDPNG